MSKLEELRKFSEWYAGHIISSIEIKEIIKSMLVLDVKNGRT